MGAFGRDGDFVAMLGTSVYPVEETRGARHARRCRQGRAGGERVQP
jgi:hypothetical protein